MGRASRYSPEVRERAVRMVFEHEREYGSQWAALKSIGSKIGCTAETLRKWVRIRYTGQGTSGKETLSNPDGTFEFLRVPPGTYTVSNDVGLPQITIVVSDRDLRNVEIGRGSEGVRVSGRIISSSTGR